MVIHIWFSEQTNKPQQIATEIECSATYTCISTPQKQREGQQCRGQYYITKGRMEIFTSEEMLFCIILTISICMD